MSAHRRLMSTILAGSGLIGRAGYTPAKIRQYGDIIRHESSGRWLRRPCASGPQKLLRRKMAQAAVVLVLRRTGVLGTSSDITQHVSAISARSSARKATECWNSRRNTACNFFLEHLGGRRQDNLDRTRPSLALCWPSVVNLARFCQLWSSADSGNYSMHVRGECLSRCSHFGAPLYFLERIEYSVVASAAAILAGE